MTAEAVSPIIGRRERRGRRSRRGRPSRGRTGLFGPFPYYSARTRRGSRVTVSGCCLPIPFTIVTTAALSARILLHR